MNDLKPCPWKKPGEKRHKVILHKTEYLVYPVCLTCGASGSNFSSEEHAVAWWNSRPGDSGDATANFLKQVANSIHYDLDARSILFALHVRAKALLATRPQKTGKDDE